MSHVDVHRGPCFGGAFFLGVDHLWIEGVPPVLDKDTKRISARQEVIPFVVEQITRHIIRNYFGSGSQAIDQHFIWRMSRERERC